MSRRVRDTSIATYHAIKQQGLLSRMRWRVYSTLYQHGPLTGRELDQRMAGVDEKRTSYHKRLPELEELGVVRSLGKRPCSITGRISYEWDVTSAMPMTLPPKAVRPTSKEFVDAADELLEIQRRHGVNTCGQPLVYRRALMKVLRWMAQQ